MKSFYDISRQYQINNLQEEALRREEEAVRERDALRVEMTEARKQIAVCEEELGRALGLASEFRRKVGTFQRYPFAKLHLHLGAILK